MPPTGAATKVKDPEYSNWLKVSLALYYLTVGLHSFIQGEVDAMHQFLLHKLYRGSGVPKPQCSSCKSKDVKQNRNTYVWKFKSPCPSHLCDIWLAELMALHTNPTSNKIYWDNCDVTAWPFVPWECAKLYMPRGQLPANTGQVKCDSQALLTLMANCKYFHGKLSSAGLKLIHTVSKIRNSVMHSEEMRLSDGVTKNFIQDIIHLLEDPTHLKALDECKLAVNEINKIVNDSIDVFFNVELEMIALMTAVNAVRQDIGKQEERTLGSVVSLKEEYIQLKEEMKTKIDTVENRVDIVETRQDTVVNDLETMENRVDCVENRVVTVENDLETMENRVDCVENRVVTVENRQNTVVNDLETMENRVDCVENRVVTVENDLETMENRVDCVENRVVTVENRQNTVVNDLETMENRVDCVENRVVTVENDLETMENRVDCVENRVVTVENRQNTVVNDLETMENRVDCVENKVVTVENRQNTVLNDLETMENRMDCVENRVVTVENDLETMENRVDCVENRVVTVENRQNTVVNDLETMENRVDCVENRIVTVENRQNTVENDLETMENRVDCVENRVVTVENRQNTVVNDLETMENRVDCVENRIVTVENRQNTVENDLETMENRMDCVENRVVTVENRQDTVENRVVTVENRQSTMEKIEDTIVKRLDTIERDVESVKESVMEKTQQQQVELSQAISASVAPLGVRVEAVEEKLTSLQESGHRTGINKLRDDLIKAYRNLRCVQVSPIFEKMRRDIDSIFVDIDIEEEQESRNVEEESKYVTQLDNAQPRSKNIIKVTSYKQIFLDERGLKFTRVYLRGKGGLGKTTFCRKVLNVWCNAHEKKVTAHDIFFQDEAVLQTFDLLFYLNLREVSEEETLIEVICTQFPLEEIPDKNVLATLLKANGDKVLFILDGLDEMIVKPKFLENIVRRRVYQNCCFLVSSRPWKISQMELQEGTEIDLLLDFKGFSKENAIKGAKKIFENCYNNGNAIENFLKDIEGNKLATQLIHVPLLLLILTQVWYENKRSLPCKLHELYISFLNLLTNRVMEKYKKDPNHRQMRFTQGDMRSPLPSKISEASLVVNFGEGLFLSLCEVAHHFLLSSQKENSLVFEETKLLNVLGDRGEEKLKIALDLGVLSVTDSVSYICRKMNVSFLHKTFQEFFTALCFIVSQDKLANFVSSIVDFNDVQQNENVIVFLVGLMPELGNSVLEKVNELCKYYWQALHKKELMSLERPNSITSEAIYFSFIAVNQPVFVRLYNISRIYLRCNDDEIGKNVLLNVSGLILFQKIFDPHPWNPAFLQCLILMGTYSTDYSLLDLRGLTGLGYLRLCHLTCELYLPESGSLSFLIMITLRLPICCCDVLGRTLTKCTRLEKLSIHDTNLHNCLLDLSNMTKLTILHMSGVTLSSSSCNVLGSTLTHCTKLKGLAISNMDLHNCVLDLSNMTELANLDMILVTMSSRCCDELGRTLTHSSNLRTLYIHNTDFQDCLLDFHNMTELKVLDMSEVTLSSSCCDVLGSTLTHCTKLKGLTLHHINLHNCVLDASNMTELTVLDMSKVTLSSICCDVLGSTLTHCTKLRGLILYKTDLHNCVLDLSNMTELTGLYISEVTLSSICCDVLGSTLTHCTKLVELEICKTDLHNCVLDLSNMKELTALEMSVVTLSSNCCNVLGNTLTHCTKLDELKICNTDLHNCLLDVSNMTELRILAISEVTLSNTCCDVLGSALTHCTKLHTLYINNMKFHNCVLDLSNMAELKDLYISEVTLSSICYDVLGSTLTHCTKLGELVICKTNLHNCVLDVSNMIELRQLIMYEVTLSSICCDVIRSTLTHCTKLNRLVICNTDFHNSLLDVSNMTELTALELSEVTLSISCYDVIVSHYTKLRTLRLENTDLGDCMLDLSMTELCELRLNGVTLSNSACQVLELTLDQLKARRKEFLHYTYEKLPSDNDKWKVNFHDPSEIHATFDPTTLLSDRLDFLSYRILQSRHGHDSI